MNTFEVQCLPGAAGAQITNEATSGNENPAAWLLEWITGGNVSDSGVRVNGYTSLTHCPLWQGVNIIAGDIAQVPVMLLRNHFDEQKDHPASRLLRLRPNALQTPSVYTETLMQWAIIWGNGVAAIHRRASRPSELIPLRPDCIRPELIAFDESQVMLYHYWSPTNGREYTFFGDDVVHIQGLTGDGIWGYPLHEVAKNTIGHGIALERHGNKSFANAARPSGVLKHPNTLKPEARAHLREEWESIHGGLNNAARVAILQEGMEFQALSMTNIDAQWIEAKKYNRIDAASLLNLPAYKLNSPDVALNRANLEEQNADYEQRTLSRWFNRLAEEYRRKLLTEKEWLSDEYQFVFDVGSFLKADIDTMSTVVDRLVKAEVMNRNEGRRYFRLPPYEGGERFGSPAINPQKDVQPNVGENRPSSDENQPESGLNSVKNAAKRAIIERLEHVLKKESVSLSQAAAGSKNFVVWLDSFYSSSGDKQATVLDVFDAIMPTHLETAVAAGLGVDYVRPTVQAWALSRKRSLLEACSAVTAEQLGECVKGFVIADAAALAEQLITTALGDDDGT